MIGRFEIIEQLSGDGEVVTYLARDPTLGRQVILRVAAAEEHQALRSQSIPWPRGDIADLLPLHEVGRDGDRVIAVYEHVAAVPLPRWLAAARRSRGDIRAATARGARAIAALHGAETVHGAVTADALWIGDDGRVWVGDHGLLAALGRTARGGPAEDRRAYEAAWRDALAAAPARRSPRTGAWLAAGALLMAGGATAAVVLGGGPATSRPAAPPRLAADLTTFAGCSDYPQFVDDDTLVFVHRGDRKDGLYAVDLDGEPRWLYDGPGRELLTQRSGTPGAVLFLSERIHQLDAATGEHRIVEQDFDYFIDPFVAGAGDALYFVSMSGRGLFRRANGAVQLLATVPAGEILMHLGLSPDGRFVVLSGGRGLYLMDVGAAGATTVELAPLPAGGTAYQRAAVVRGGRVVFYPRRDGIVRLDLATGAERVVLPGAVAPGGLTLSPDARTLVWSDCRTRGTVLDVTDPASPRELFRESLSWPGVGTDGSLVFTLDQPSGALAAHRSPDGRITPLSSLELGVAMTPSLSADGTEVAFTVDGLAPGIYVAPADASTAPRLVAPGGVHYPMWLPDGRLAFVRPDEAGSARLWAIPRDGGEPVSIHPRSRRLADVIRATGEVLLVDGGFEHLWLWDPVTGTERDVPLPAALDHHVLAVVRASPDGSTALVTTGMFDAIWEIDLRGGDRTRQLRHGDLSGFAGAFYTPDGHLVIVENHAEGRLHRAGL